jgi:hypothetical protein
MTGENDPYSPDYSPTADGGSTEGDPGSGQTFGADLYHLYYAGRVSLPDTAASYAGIGNDVYTVRGQIQGLVDAGIFEVNRLLTVQQNLNDGFAKTAEHCEIAGQALVTMANDYARTDEDALQEFNRLLENPGNPVELERLDEPPIEVPDVQTPDDE